MRVPAGVITPTRGGVFADGQPLNHRATLRGYQRRLGYLPQEPGLYPDLTCAETLDYIAAVKGIHHRRTRREHVEQTLQHVGLTDLAKRRAKTLSTGMRRRLGIGQALIADPELLIVDEPTAGLDPANAPGCATCSPLSPMPAAVSCCPPTSSTTSPPAAPT